MSRDKNNQNGNLKHFPTNGSSVTQIEFERLRQDIRDDITQTKSDFKEGIVEMKKDFKEGISQLKSDFKQDFTEVKHCVKRLEDKIDKAEKRNSTTSTRMKIIWAVGGLALAFGPTLISIGAKLLFGL